MKLSNAKKIAQSFIESNAALSTTANNSEYLVPMLWSLPGEGKTSMIEALAEEMGYKVVTVVAAQFDAGELGGFPMVDTETKTYNRARPFFLPTSDEKTILFFDELPQAPVANQNIIAQCVNERRIGEHVLPRNTLMVCAGNPMSSRAGTNPMPSHLKDRLTHFHIETDHVGFRNYALAKGFLPEVTGFINDRPEFLQKFDPNQDASPSPRSWERANAILNIGLGSELEGDALKGQIGEAALADFTGYLRVYRDLPNSEDIFADPENTMMPERADVMYALCSMLAHKATVENSDALVTYLRRFNQLEFAAFLMRDALQRNPELKKSKAIVSWIMKEGKDLLL